MRKPILVTGLAASLISILAAAEASAGTVTAKGAIIVLTNANQLQNGQQGLFNEGPTNGNIPLGVYTPQGLTFRTGQFSAILPGSVVSGDAFQGQYTDASFFPAPIGAGGQQSGATNILGSVGTFTRFVTQVGLVASRNGTQHLTVFRKNGTIIGQVTWTPNNDASFIGLDTLGTPIAMVAYGNDDLFAGAAYDIAGVTNFSDTWAWGFPCDHDGVIDLGEGCDDGNSVGGDGCTPTCSVEYCGNGILDVGEVCDDGNQLAGDDCSADCESLETCGNGIIDVAKGEACDDGNLVSGDGCQANCATPDCGDGALDAGEACDDDNLVDGDGCNATCTSNESCGNGVVDGSVGEECDDGALAAGDGCSASCRVERCGDDTVDPGEVCDDGNTAGADGCSPDCKSLETCGNGLVDGFVGEQCDDANASNGDGCSSICELEYCGNGTLDPNELCDDGNQTTGDGCAADCGSDETCGNMIVDLAIGEACDDGNTTNGDGCSATCALPGCGDGIVDATEACDDANTADGDGCSATCKSDETCGNGIIDLGEGEQCDDSNATAGDGCSATCRLEYCGNGTVDGGETCDDGNADGGDGCSADCLSNETCGNGFPDPSKGEQCDDGNTVDGDGCQADCKLAICGDGVVGANEVCDDGNTADGDGCNATCTSDETCGNGVVDAAKQEICDLGPNNGKGVCSTTCTVDGGASAEGGGCGCKVADERDATAPLALLIAGVVLAMKRRRRAR